MKHGVCQHAHTPFIHAREHTVKPSIGRVLQQKLLCALQGLRASGWQCLSVELVR